MRARFGVLFGLVLLLLPLGVAADEPVSVTFLGFQAFPDQTSRIFAHVSDKPALEKKEAPLEVVFRMKNARISVRNNKNPLNLEHFATPVKRARLAQRDDDIELVIELKKEVPSRHRFSDNTDGTVSLQVDFPAP